MKKKIIIIDKITKKGRSNPEGNKVVLEVEQRDLAHFETQLNNRSHIFVDKKKRVKNGYCKHKKDFREDE